VSAARLKEVPKEGHVPVRPDLAIEVVSPGDEVYELDDKLADYESAGIPLVWILNPNLKTVSVVRPQQPTVKLRAEDPIDRRGIHSRVLGQGRGLVSAGLTDHSA